MHLFLFDIYRLLDSLALLHQLLIHASIKTSPTLRIQMDRQGNRNGLQGTRATKQVRRIRPSYVTLFIDHLRRFHDTQPKYRPPNTTADQSQVQPKPHVKIKSVLQKIPSGSPSTRPKRQSTPLSSGPSKSSSKQLSRTGGSEPSAKSVTSSRPLSRPASDSTTSLKSIPNDRSSTTSIIKPTPMVRSETGLAHPTSEIFRQGSPAVPGDQPMGTTTENAKAPRAALSSRQPPLPPIRNLLTESTIQSGAAAGTNVQMRGPAPPAVAPELPPSPEAPKQEDIRMVQKQLEMLQMQKQAGKESSELANVSSIPSTKAAQTGPGESLPRLPKMKSQKFFVQSIKESTDPSLTQTPPAAVGGSSSAILAKAQRRQIKEPSLVEEHTQIINGKAVRTITRTPVAQLSADQQKKISLSRAIADQTPNAIRTLGPGFQISMPGERSKQQINNNNPNPNPNNNNNIANNPRANTGNLEAVPSDYEHIYHYASNLVDEKHGSQKQLQAQPRVEPPVPPKPRTLKHQQIQPVSPIPPVPPVVKHLNLPHIPTGQQKGRKKQDDKKGTRRRFSPLGKKTK